MKITELIARLEETLATHGDLHVENADGRLVDVEVDADTGVVVIDA